MVVTVVQAVDVAQPSVPACPLALPYASFGEARHPDCIGEQTVAEVEIFYLNLILACRHAIDDVFVLAYRSEGRIVLDPAQHVGYTDGVPKIAPYGLGSGERQLPRGHSFIRRPNIIINLSLVQIM